MTGIGNELAHAGFTGLPRRPECGSWSSIRLGAGPGCPTSVERGLRQVRGTRTGSLTLATATQRLSRGTTSAAVLRDAPQRRQRPLDVTIPAVVAATAPGVTIPKMISITATSWRRRCPSTTGDDDVVPRLPGEKPGTVPAQTVESRVSDCAARRSVQLGPAG